MDNRTARRESSCRSPEPTSISSWRPLPRAQFLQVTKDAKYLFRVYEKFTMRIKDESAVEPLDLRDDSAPTSEPRSCSLNRKTKPGVAQSNQGGA